MANLVCFTKIVDIPKPFRLPHLLEAFRATVEAHPETLPKYSIILASTPEGCFIAESESDTQESHQALREWIPELAVFQYPSSESTDDMHAKFILNFLVQIALLATKKKVK